MVPRSDYAKLHFHGLRFMLIMIRPRILSKHSGARGKSALRAQLWALGFLGGRKAVCGEHDQGNFAPVLPTPATPKFSPDT